MNDNLPVVINEEQSTLIQKLSVMEINSSDQEKVAIDGLAVIQSIKRNIAKSRKELVAPMNEKVKEINQGFKKILEPVEQAESAVKSGLLGWRQKEAERVRIEQAKIDKENAERERMESEGIVFIKTSPEIAPPAPVEKTVASTMGKATIRKTWTFEIEDSNLIPRNYLIPDEKLIRQAIHAGTREIPGIKIYQREDIAGGRL